MNLRNLSMNISVLLGKASCSRAVAVTEELCARLADAGFTVVSLDPARPDSLPPDCDMLLSIGGDGTFLLAASIAAPAGVPVLGVNLGRMGFLSDNSPESVAKALLSGRYEIENRILLQAEAGGKVYHALNEVVLSRSGSAMLGVELTFDGKKLPACWGDGLLIATPSGSTAYSLSVGGPIVIPDAKVLIVAPVAPHNLNIRPIIVPRECKITLSFLSRDPYVKFSADNNFVNIPSSETVRLSMAPFSLKRVKLDGDSFIKALSDKLFWGEDKRNGR